MPKFRKKPVVVEAFQWNGAGMSPPLPEWLLAALMVEQGRPGSLWRNGKYLEVGTLEGILSASPNDWIIRGVKGELYPCKPDIFEATYEPVEQSELTPASTIDPTAGLDPKFNWDKNDA